ncbi:MAG: ABC transporter substrate-binding protein [Pseudomonadota bacterium]
MSKIPFKSSPWRLVGLLAATLVMGSGAAAQVPESSEPIKIVVNNWNSQLVLANISGRLLEKLGYNVAYMPAHTQMQYSALANGDMHFQVEVWEGTMAEAFEKQVARGGIIDAGSHDAVTREDWWYPAYVEEICPGLPDWQALKDCSAKLATPETGGKGRYLAGPSEWEKPDRERVEALGLDIVVVNADDASTLWRELEAASQSKQPIILFNWTPNWVEAEYPGNFVDFPDHDPDCEADPKWGLNPEVTHDCGNPKQGWLKKGVWSGFEETWPCAYRLVETINFTNDQIADAAAKVDVGGASPEEAAAQWLDENEAVWRAWMPACAP